MRRALLIAALFTLGGCASWVDSTRAGIYRWCENTPEYCDINAVQP